jgi:multimeric flavodoxin WrbA
MNIIAINGSPRKSGSTSKLLSWILEGATLTGVHTELIQLADLNIGYCQGCNQCLIHKECILKDDFHDLMNKLLSADGLILGSPVYEGSPSAQMKTLMDRVALLTLYAGIFEGKLSIGASTSGIAPTKKTSVTMADIFGARIGYIGHKTDQVLNCV